MRRMDRRCASEFGIPSLLLMEHAGRAVAEEALRFRPRRALLVCGGGNNGGDGFVAARHLANRGVRCTVVYFQPPAQPDPALHFVILRKLRVPLARWGRLSAGRRRSFLQKTDVVVDAIFGTGLTRPVGGPYRTAIEEINRARRPVVSVDLPSGMHADTGEPMGACVRATRTVTLGLPKRAFLRRAARAYTGTVVVADISLPARLTRRSRRR